MRLVFPVKDQNSIYSQKPLMETFIGNPSFCQQEKYELSN